jgi:hypothetical protein
LVVSPLLLVELDSVLGRKRFNRITIAEIEQFVAGVRNIAEVVPDAPAPRPHVTRGPAEDYLVALPQSAGADPFVFGDLDLTGAFCPVIAADAPSGFPGDGRGRGGRFEYNRKAGGV